jgi:hypothetical protein
VIGQLFIQVVPEIPPDAQPISSYSYQLPLGADPFEEHHELELEEDSRIDRWSSTFLLGRADQVADEAQVELSPR